MSKYRTTDLFIWGLILCVFETLILKAGTSLFPAQPYTVSLVPAVVAIVYMRWGLYGMAHAFLGGVVICLASGLEAGLRQVAVYAFGNLLSAVVVLWLKGREKDIRDSVFLSAMFAAIVALLMQVGRGVVSLVLGDTISGAVGFIATDVLSGVFAIILVLIARKMDGLFERQISYLLRVQEAEKEARHEREGY